MQTQIIKNAPPFESRKLPYGFDKLEIGDCLVIETAKPLNAQAAAYSWARRTPGRKVQVQTDLKLNQVRVRRVA